MTTILRPRLLLVVPSLTSFRTFFMDVAKAWASTGGECAVAAGDALASCKGNPASGEESWNVIPLPPFRSGDMISMVRAARSLRDAVAHWRPTIVHAHFLAAASIAALARTPFAAAPPWWIATFHGLHAPLHSGFRGMVFGACELAAAARMDEAWVLNEEDRVFLTRWIRRSRVHCHESWGVGCDLDRMDPARFPEPRRQDLRRLHGFAASDLIVAFVGRCVAFKGFGQLVRAFWQAAERVPELRLLVVGAVDSVHDSGLGPDDVQRLVTDPRVAVVGWQDDVAPWISMADIVALPSRREGMPVVLMESLSLGVPVVTANTRGCRDVVTNGVDGLVVPVASDVALARALESLAVEPSRLATMRGHALEGRHRFCRTRYVCEQLDAYGRLLGRPHLSSAGDPARVPVP